MSSGMSRGKQRRAYKSYKFGYKNSGPAKAGKRKQYGKPVYKVYAKDDKAVKSRTRREGARVAVSGVRKTKDWGAMGRGFQMTYLVS